MRRRPTFELFDTDSGTPAEIAAALEDLKSVNRRLGGVTTTRELLRKVARSTGQRYLSLLEVAAGTGFVPADAARCLRPEGILFDTTLLDRAATHLPENGSAQKVAADALTLPFSNSTFDIVSCSLFLHHLSPQQVVEFARESLRVSKVAVVVNDLVRHWLHLALAYAGMPLYRSRLTRHDAPASVKQAYTLDEMRPLLLEGGAAKVEVERRYLFRMGVIAWKQG
jgi:ubiquinone/menaquinone biosynthesis C-methylase UbiE